VSTCARGLGDFSKEFLQVWQIWPRVMDLLFSILGREYTRVTCEVRRSHTWNSRKREEVAWIIRKCPYSIFVHVTQVS
jgi:hypothetical protein